MEEPSTCVDTTPEQSAFLGEVQVLSLESTQELQGIPSCDCRTDRSITLPRVGAYLGSIVHIAARNGFTVHSAVGISSQLKKEKKKG